MNLSEKARKARSEYQKIWRQNNPDKWAAYQERYWTRWAEKMKGMEPELNPTDSLLEKGKDHEKRSQP